MSVKAVCHDSGKSLGADIKDVTQETKARHIFSLLPYMWSIKINVMGITIQIFFC